MKTLLVIDGNSILNRAYYGVRPLSTRTGLPTNAVYGFINILKKHMDALAPDRILCAFDQKGPTFRHTMYDGYKATRHGMPEELAVQLPYAKEVAAALGCKVATLADYEADDILGTAAALADATGELHTYILTGDRDSLQLITDTTTVVLVKTKEDLLYTPAQFLSDYGVTPAQFVDVKALMGDSSDNIPGVPGIGEKTAFKLIAAAGSLDAVYANLETLPVSKSVVDKLIAGRDSAFLSQKLARICCSAPLDPTLIATDRMLDRERLFSLFTELEFTALKSRFSEEAKPIEPKEKPTFLPLTDLSSLPEDIPLAVAPSADGGLFVAFGDTKALISREDAPAVLSTHEIFCYDYKALYGHFSKEGVSLRCTFDVMLAAYLLSPGEGNYPLARLVARYLSVECDDPSPAETAALVAELAPVLAEELAVQGMTDLLLQMELPLAEVLSEMEDAGFTLDAQGLHTYIAGLQETADELKASIYALSGTEFNLNSPKQLGEVLFERLGLPPYKKTRLGYSTDAETLDRLRPYHPIIDQILEYRQLVKLTGTYGDNLIALQKADGKIHSRFNQTGTATGRISSNDPNMQNIPVRGQLGRELRRYFIPSDKNRVLLDADYSQIELRLLAELSADATMREAFLSGEDIHRATASQVFGVPLDEVTGELRRRAKAVNFGIVYGIGDYSLSQDLGITVARAGEYIRSYLDTYPGVASYLLRTVENAKKDGFTTTMFGRKRFIPELFAQNKLTRSFGERVAKNSPIQGSAADIIKIAMIRTRDALKAAGIDAKLILQVHDELIVESHRKDAEVAAEILCREMENAVKTAIPLTVEVSSGDNWYEAKE